MSYWSHLYNFQHFHSCYFTITIQVVHVEGPVQLLLKTASWSDGERTNELSEVDGAISVFIKGSEGVLGKLRRISVWKELQNKIINRSVGNAREQTAYLPAKLLKWGIYAELLVGSVQNWRYTMQSFCNGYSAMIIKNLFLQKSLSLPQTIRHIYLTLLCS